MHSGPKEFPTLNSKEKDNLVDELTQYGLANGLIMYPEGFKSFEADLAPVTIFPTPFPRSEFEKAKALANPFSTLYGNIVSEKKWLLNIAEELSKFDPGFTGKLYECYKKAKNEGIAQNVSLALTRSDYMFDTITKEIKQVEYNTVSVSFAGLSNKVGLAHKYLNDSGLYKYGKRYYDEAELPISESPDGLAEGLGEAARYYNNHFADSKNTIVLFVIQPSERNAFDQRLIEYSLLRKFDVRSKRVELAKFTTRTKVDKESRRLYLDNDEVSVVYYRSGYSPSEYNNEAAWDARVLAETTMAIKCPSLLVQLSGAKKIQQLLTNPQILDQFYPLSSSYRKELESTFCKIYPLDGSDKAQTARKLAFEHPENYVLKPQREGGGNNIYKEAIPGFLNSIPESQWAGYILMELIHPPLEKNVLLRNGKLFSDGIVSELGIYNSLLFDENTGMAIKNTYGGHLLRSKISTSNEGGVAAGYGCVDSLYLY